MGLKHNNESYSTGLEGSTHTYPQQEIYGGKNFEATQ